MKNIRFVVLCELFLFAAVFVLNIIMGNWGFSAIIWFLDPPSLMIIVLVLIPGLLIMGAWKDFVKSFSVGIRQYSLLELKNIINAVEAAQKLTIFAALFAIIISGVQLLGRFDDPSTIGPNLAVCFLSGFYAVIIEFLLLPVRLNAEKKMNEEMDLGE
jgi:flagellar motor component MotA